MQTNDLLFYFAYGANMDPEWLLGRCPSARFAHVAELHEHRLVFPRISGRWGGGVAGRDARPLGERVGRYLLRCQERNPLAG